MNSEIAYSLETSKFSESTHFAIDQNTGVLTTRTSFDREDPQHIPKYHVVAISQDKGTPPLSSKVTITVLIVDQNDQPPKFAQARYEANVPEDAKIGTSIRDLTATDGDIGENARLDYFVSSGDASQNFRMETVYSANNYGILILDGKLDYERKKTYTITVTATDRKDSATVQVVINVSNPLANNRQLKQRRTATAKKTSNEKGTSRYFYFAIIPIRSTCTM